MITCSPGYIWAPAKDKTALLSDWHKYRGQSHIVTFLLCNCTHCQQISTGSIPYISLYVKDVKWVKSNKLIQLTNAMITLQ